MGPTLCPFILWVDLEHCLVNHTGSPRDNFFDAVEKNKINVCVVISVKALANQVAIEL